MRVTITIHGYDPITIHLAEGEQVDDFVTIDLADMPAVQIGARAGTNFEHVWIMIDEEGDGSWERAGVVFA